MKKLILSLIILTSPLMATREYQDCGFWYEVMITEHLELCPCMINLNDPDDVPPHPLNTRDSYMIIKGHYYKVKIGHEIKRKNPK